MVADVEFPFLVIATLTAAAEASRAANDDIEAQRLLAEARTIAKAKGAVAELALLEDRVEIG